MEWEGQVGFYKGWISIQQIIKNCAKQYLSLMCLAKTHSKQEHKCYSLFFDFVFP